MKHQLHTASFLVLSVMNLLMVAPLCADQSEFKIGLPVCLTGPCAADGQGAIEGAQLAADEINGHGGVLGRRIKLVPEDSADSVSGAKAVLAFEHLRLDPEIRYLIGPSWTPGGLALAPVISKLPEYVITSPSLGVRSFHEAGKNIFNTRGVDETPTRMAARAAYESGWRKAAIFSSQQPWELLQGEYFEDEFTKLGGKIVAKVEPVPSATSITTEALKIAASKPDGVFFSNVVQLAVAAKELRKIRFNAPKFAAFLDSTRLAEADGALEGVNYYSFAVPTPAFAAKYEARFHRKPEIPAAAAYDAVFAYAKGIESAKTFDPPVVEEQIVKLDFEGASGRVRFDPEGCVQKDINLWRVENGEFKKLP